MVLSPFPATAAHHRPRHHPPNVFPAGNFAVQHRSATSALFAPPWMSRAPTQSPSACSRRPQAPPPCRPRRGLFPSCLSRRVPPSWPIIRYVHVPPTSYPPPCTAPTFVWRNSITVLSLLTHPIQLSMLPNALRVCSAAYPSGASGLETLHPSRYSRQLFHPPVQANYFWQIWLHVVVTPMAQCLPSLKRDRDTERQRGRDKHTHTHREREREREREYQRLGWS